MGSVDLKTGGMHCASCAMLIELSLGDVPGVEAVKVDATASRTHVEYDPQAVDVEHIIAAMVEAGYTASVIT